MTIPIDPADGNPRNVRGARKTPPPGSAGDSGPPAAPVAGGPAGTTLDRESPDPAVSLPGSLLPAEPGPSSPLPLAAEPREAAAGIPDPVTRAAPDRVAARARGRTKTPAGEGRSRAAGASPAGSQAIAAAMSEAELEIHVRHLIRDLGLLWYHTHDSRHSPSGFPDLVIVGHGVIYRELKTARGKVTDAQAEWLHALVMAEQDACVWRPADLISGLIGRRLAALAGLPVLASTGRWETGGAA